MNDPSCRVFSVPMLDYAMRVARVHFSMTVKMAGEDGLLLLPACRPPSKWNGTVISHESLKLFITESHWKLYLYYHHRLVVPSGEVHSLCTTSRTVAFCQLVFCCGSHGSLQIIAFSIKSQEIFATIKACSPFHFLCSVVSKYFYLLWLVL